MKKSSFTAMILGIVSFVLFALGMCMALVEEWKAFIFGIAVGCVGILLGFVTLLIWRKMEHKAPIKLSGKKATCVVVGIVGVLTLGVGMCLSMVWNQMILGIVVGLVGIIVLMMLIPIIKGFK